MRVLRLLVKDVDIGPEKIAIPAPCPRPPRQRRHPHSARAAHGNLTAGIAVSPR